MNTFDLEQDILNCWSVTTDIDLLYKNVMETEMSKDDIANVLLGIKCLYEMKFNRAWSEFEKVTSEYYEFKKQTKAQET